MKNSPEQKFVSLIRNSAYFKRPNYSKREQMGQKYHKGFEVRISCIEEEIEKVQNICAAVNINTGNPYKKSKYRYIVPIYGAINFYRTLKMVTDFY